MINDALLALTLIREEEAKQKLLHWYRECIVADRPPILISTPLHDDAQWLDAT